AMALARLQRALERAGFRRRFAERRQKIFGFRKSVPRILDHAPLRFFLPASKFQTGHATATSIATNRIRCAAARPRFFVELSSTPYGTLTLFSKCNAIAICPKA